MRRPISRFTEFLWTWFIGIPTLLILGTGLIRDIRYGAH